jgi:phospholipid transport system substrate-binding protein
MTQAFFKIILGFCFLVKAVMAENSPMPMVVDINEHVLANLKSHQAQLKQHPEIIQQTIRQYFIPHVDTQGMARSVLGRQAWQQASPSEKQAFTQEFTNLVLRTYARPLSDFNGETVKFVPFKASPVEKFSQVQTVILRANGQRIPITYHLVMVNQDWKIYDLSVEGVSLLASFKNQFGDALKQKSLATVIHALHEKNHNVKS